MLDTLEHVRVDLPHPGRPIVMCLGRYRHRHTSDRARVVARHARTRQIRSADVQDTYADVRVRVSHRNTRYSTSKTLEISKLVAAAPLSDFRVFGVE